jgi:hypothetical protein
VTIHFKQLLDEACARTKLTNFGDLSFLEPLEKLVESINNDSQLTVFGVQAMPEMLIGFLVNRLEVEDWYARHPEINDEQIVAPVFGIGLPRTGSTALGHMMAQDSNTRVLRDWESKRHCPPPETATQFNDPRIAESRAGYDFFATVLPEIVSLLPYDEQGPQECAYLLSEAFLPHFAFEVFVHTPSYAQWVETVNIDMRPAYQYHKRVIKLMQWRCPPKRWYLRTPIHTFALDAINHVYPDAQFVMTHRDPAKALPSVSSLMYLFRRAYVENPLPETLGPSQQEYWARALEKALNFRKKIGEQRFFDVSHRQQIADPTVQVKALYAKLGWPYNNALEAKIRQWQANNPKGEHRFSPEFFGLDANNIAQRFAFYAKHFDHLY